MGASNYTSLRDAEEAGKRMRTGITQHLLRKVKTTRIRVVLSLILLMICCLILGFFVSNSKQEDRLLLRPAEVAPNTQAEEVMKGACEQVFTEHSINPHHFGPVVAHSIHSLSLADIHHYFSTLATEENNIPVVDLNLTSPTPVLAHAPALPASPFNSLGMRIADQIFSHMDDNMYDIKNMNGLERMAHALHMHEMWESARPYFTSLEEKPASSSLCSCVVNVEDNGVMENLRLNALKIREPEAFYKPYTRGQGAPYSHAIVVKDSNSSSNSEPQARPYDIKYSIPIYTHRFQYKSTGTEELAEAMPALVNSTSWQVWRSASITQDQMMIRNHGMLALFLHCRLKM